jgi:hypothetical protein
MKTRKYNLNAIAMGVALALGSSAVAAQEPGHPAAALDRVANAERHSLLPTFDNSELTGLAGVESALSIIAAKVHIDHTFCLGGTPTKPFTYRLGVSAFDTEGTAVLDYGAGNGGFGLNVRLTPSNDLVGITLGSQVDVTADSGSRIRGATGFSDIIGYAGLHHWSTGSYIFNDSANWTFTDGQNGRRIPYGEVSIKDYFKQIVNGDSAPALCDTGAQCIYDPQSWEFDWGLEKVLKHGYPVTKWIELSWYKRPDGGDGFLKVKKEVVKPGGAVCRIVYTAHSFVDDGAFSYGGTVAVFRPNDR